MVQKRVLVLQHVWGDPPGLFGEILQKHEIGYDTINPDEAALPDPLMYAAVIALGGPQYAGDERVLREEKLLIRTLVEKDIPFLGVCLGGQLLAHVCGAEVKRNAAFEVGFYDVELTEAARRDPLYEGFSPGAHRVFHWHSDVFDLPTNALLLETGQDVYYQAFRVARRAYGLQYHPELTEEMLSLWLNKHPAREKALVALGQDIYQSLEDKEKQGYFLYRSQTATLFTNFLKISGLPKM